MADIRDLLSPPRTRARRNVGARPPKSYAPRRRRSIGASPWTLALLAGAALGLWGEPLFDLAVPGEEERASADAWRAAQDAADARAAETARYRAEMGAQEAAPALEFRTGREVEPGARWAGSVRVVDGDTFWAGGEKIRIADIDTPEVRARCRAEAVLAGRATRRLGQLLNAGPFTLEPVDRDEDRYGRKLRVVMRDGESLGGQLVSEGLARWYEGGRRSWC